jgi:hypothetical protein
MSQRAVAGRLRREPERQKRAYLSDRLKRFVGGDDDPEVGRLLRRVVGRNDRRVSILLVGLSVEGDVNGDGR